MLCLRGGILMSIGNFPQSWSQAMLVGRLGVAAPIAHLAKGRLSDAGGLRFESQVGGGQTPHRPSRAATRPAYLFIICISYLLFRYYFVCLDALRTFSPALGRVARTPARSSQRTGVSRCDPSKGRSPSPKGKRGIPHKGHS